jgi:8-oxo-dGTP diphosphatase
MDKPKVSPGLKKVATFCILTADNKYLLLKRAFPPNQGKFVPVGGKLDPYESPQEAVIREVKEETGIEIKLVEYCGTLVETAPVEYNWVSFIYKAEIAYQNAPHCNEGELVWVDRADLDSLDTPPTDMAIYQMIDKGQKFALDATFDANLNMIEMIDLLSGQKW